MSIEKEDDAILLERQLVLNKVIAAGLNSLSHCTTYTASTPDKELLDTFVSQDFDQVLPCWDMLNEQIRFYIFKTHIKSFEKFMRGEKRGDG